MTDMREPAFGLRPPVQVDALPADDARVIEQVRRIAELSTPKRELDPEGRFVGWIDPDRRAVA